MPRKKAAVVALILGVWGVGIGPLLAIKNDEKWPAYPLAHPSQKLGESGKGIPQIDLGQVRKDIPHVPTSSSQKRLVNLPTEIIVKIMEPLSPKDFTAFRNTCKRFDGIARALFCLPEESEDLIRLLKKFVVSNSPKRNLSPLFLSSLRTPGADERLYQVAIDILKETPVGAPPCEDLPGFLALFLGELLSYATEKEKQMTEKTKGFERILGLPFSLRFPPWAHWQIPREVILPQGDRKKFLYSRNRLEASKEDQLEELAYVYRRAGHDQTDKTQRMQLYRKSVFLYNMLKKVIDAAELLEKIGNLSENKIEQKNVFLLAAELYNAGKCDIWAANAYFKAGYYSGEKNIKGYAFTLASFLSEAGKSILTNWIKADINIAQDTIKKAGEAENKAQEAENIKYIQALEEFQSSFQGG